MKEGSVNIDLGSGYRVISDSRQYILQKAVKPDPKRPGKNDGNKYKSVAYHSTIDAVFNSAQARMERLCGAQDMAELKAHQHEIFSRLCERFGPHFKITITEKEQ